MLPAGSAWRAIRFVPTQRVSYINLFPRSFASSEKVEMDEQEIKERNVYSIIGEDGFEKLSRAFYRSGFNGRGPISILCNVFVSLFVE
jgi:hypothetical protein